MKPISRALLALTLFLALAACGKKPEPPAAPKPVAPAPPTPKPSPTPDERPPAAWGLLESVSLEDFNKAWKLDLKADGEAAGEVLAGLAGQALPPSTNPAVQAAFAKPISIDLKGVSRWQAMEQAAAAAGLYPVLPDWSALTPYAEKPVIKGIPFLCEAFEPLPRPLPVVFAGPFVVQMTAFEPRPEFSTLEIDIEARIRTPFRSVGMVSGLDHKSFRISSVQNLSGKELFDFRNPDSVKLSYPNRRVDLIQRADDPGELVEFAAKIKLKKFVRADGGVKLIKGELAASVPVEVGEAVFDKLEEGAIKRLGDVDVTLSYKGPSEVNVARGIEREMHKEIDGETWEVRASRQVGGIIIAPSPDDCGIIIGKAHGMLSDGLQSTYVSRKSRGAPLRVKVVTREEVVKYPFEFPAIAVKDASQLADGPTQLMFPGFDAPANAEFVEFTDKRKNRRIMSPTGETLREAEYRILNPSNKAIAKLWFRHDYLDKEGKPQGTGESKFPSETHDSNPLVPAGGEGRVEEVLWDLPETATSVRATVKKIQFMDGSIWEAPSPAVKKPVAEPVEFDN